VRYVNSAPVRSDTNSLTVYSSPSPETAEIESPVVTGMARAESRTFGRYSPLAMSSHAR
jgi:hypothetical protein